MNDHTNLDPLKIASQRPDRDHLFRGLSIHHRLVKLNDIATDAKPKPREDAYWEALEAQQQHIQEAMNQLSKTIANRNIAALRQAACDVEVKLHGLFYQGSLPYMSDMATVVDSLLTRFCVSDEDLDATFRKYFKLGVETYVKEDEDTGYFVVFSAKDQTGTDGKFYPKDKWMKSAFHREIDINPSFR